jgi:hypothetical protein
VRDGPPRRLAHVCSLWQRALDKKRETGIVI